MGSALTGFHSFRSSRSIHHEPQQITFSFSNSRYKRPKCYDPRLIQFLKIIFRNDFAKDAFITFIRHDEKMEADDKDQNYFKKGNFATIGGNEDKIVEVLSHNGENDEEVTYTSLKPLFDDMDSEMKKQVLSYRGGSSHDILTAFQNANDEIILLMAIEALPRFQESDSYKRWWNREKSFEFTISGFFSPHSTSSRTVTLQASTGAEIEGLWSRQCDIFPSILHCLNKFPIATAIIQSNNYLFAYASQPYAELFGLTSTHLVNTPFNLLQQNEHISLILEDFQTAKFEMKCQKNHSSSDVTSIVVAIKPINDQNQNCIYFFIVIVDIQSQSFCLDTLKLSMDLFDIFPTMLRVR